MEKRKYNFHYNILSYQMEIPLLEKRQEKYCFLISFYYIKWKFLSWKTRKYNFLYIILLYQMGIPFKGKEEVSFSSYHFIISNGNSMEKGKYCFLYYFIISHGNS